MAGEINISVLIRLAAEQARREAAAFGGEVKALGGAAEEASRKTTSAGQSIGQTGDASLGAAHGITAAVSALAQAVSQAASVAAQMGRAATAADSMQSSVTGLTRTMNNAETAMQRQVAAFAGIRKGTESTFAAQLRHGIMLDELRAKYNPLFAASRQYEMALLDIAEAERLGAISAQEAAAAREAAGKSILNPNGAGSDGANGGQSGLARAAATNLSYQINDIAMMTAMGQDPFMLMIQQGPQVAQIISQLTEEGESLGETLMNAYEMILTPWGLVTMAVIGGGAALIQWFMSTAAEIKTFDEHASDLTTTLGRMKSGLDRLGDARLGDTFGNLTEEVRTLTAGMLELDKAAALRSLEGFTGTFLNDQIEPKWYQEGGLSGGEGGLLSLYAGHVGGAQPGDAGRAARYAELGAANSYGDFKARTDEIKELAKGGDIDAVVKKMNELRAAMIGANPGDVSSELIELLGNFSDTAIEIAGIQSKLNGTGLATAITHQIDQMVLSYSQQVELAEASLRFGENSVQVEEVRASHARQALEAKLQEMKVEENSADAVRARAALEAQLATDAEAAAQRRQTSQEEILADYARQAELSTAILKYGEDSAQVEEVRARHAWEVQEARLKEMGMLPPLIAMIRSLFVAERHRANAIKDAAAARGAEDLLADLREEAAINQAIVQHGEDSLRVKELQIAAERRAFEQTLATMQATEELKQQLREAWGAARGLGASDPFGSITAGNNYLADQQERLDKLRLEHSLLGQNEIIQKRTIALWQVERDLRQEGIDLTSARAAEIRVAALQEFELTRSIERQSAAWQSVQSSAENAIDSIVDKLMGGDIEGALEALAGNVVGMFTELSIQNPLKNAILGTDYGTINDVGGLKGIWGRLFGGDDSAASPAAARSPGSVGSMQVTASSVTIGGPGAMSFLSGSTGAAIAGSAPGAWGGTLGGAGDVQSQVWQFFAGKGMAPHHIAGIMGNIQAESGFNPLAEGDNGNAFGLFQWNDRRHKLFDFIGGKQNLGDVQKQLEFAWHELNTSESGAYNRLLKTTDASGATDAFMRGFERPADWAMQKSWGERLGGAEAALAKFGTTATATTANLGTLGTGMDAFGNALVSGVNGLSSGGAQGGLMGFLGTLASGIASSLNIPGFATGGVHAGGLRIVGEKGPELEYTGPSTILPADLTRSVLGTRPPAAASENTATVVQMQPVFQFNTAQKPEVRQEEFTDSRGQRQQRYVISDATAEGISTPGGRGAQALQQGYNLRKPAVRRG